MDRKKQMIQLRRKGETYQGIGDRFGISRQRIYQILTGYKSPYRETDVFKARYKEYYKKIIRPNNRKQYQKWKKMVLKHYGGDPPKCANCGYNNINCLEIDHLNNEGTTQRRELFGSQGGSGTRFYRWLIKNNFPPGYQILCKNCNWLKYLRYKEAVENFP